MKAKRRERRTADLRALFTGLLLTGFVIGLAPAAAQAGTATSATGSFSVNGISYRNQAQISTSPGSAGAFTILFRSSGCIPSGWGGARARLFNSANSLVQESTIGYNSGCVTGFDRVTTRSASGTWNSYGVTWGWNGSGYSPVYTFRSPNQSS